MSVRRSIFRNAQWEVVPSGLASLRSGAPCCYEIDAEALLAMDEYRGRAFYDWPIYVAQKPWVIAPLFFEAFEAALDIHEGRYPGKVDRELLNASIGEARRLAATRLPRQRTTSRASSVTRDPRQIRNRTATK
jgi:hypothetical protein